MASTETARWTQDGSVEGFLEATGRALDQGRLPGRIFSECLQCHTEIHGSNWDREFFR